MDNIKTTSQNAQVTIKRLQGPMKNVVCWIAVLLSLETIGLAVYIFTSLIHWASICYFAILAVLSICLWSFYARARRTEIALLADCFVVSNGGKKRVYAYSDFDKCLVTRRSKRFTVLFVPPNSDSKIEKRATDISMLLCSPSYKGYVCIIGDTPNFDSVWEILNGKIPLVNTDDRALSCSSSVEKQAVEITYSREPYCVTQLIGAIIALSPLISFPIAIGGITIDLVLVVTLFTLIDIWFWSVFYQLSRMRVTVNLHGVKTYEGARESYYEYTDFDVLYVLPRRSVTYIVFSDGTLDARQKEKIIGKAVGFQHHFYYDGCLQIICSKEKQVEDILNIVSNKLTIMYD